MPSYFLSFFIFFIFYSLHYYYYLQVLKKMVRDWEKLDKTAYYYVLFFCSMHLSIFIGTAAAHCWCTHVSVHLFKGMIPTKIVAKRNKPW